MRVAQAIQANLLDVGIVISVASPHWKYHPALVRDGKSPFHRMGWVADYLDADNFLYYNFFSGNIGTSNGNFYANADVDRVLHEARTIGRPARRISLYRKAERKIAHDAPWICLYYFQSSLLRHPDVHGLNLTALGMHMIRFETVWLDEKANDTTLKTSKP